ncbi:MAG TPA: HAD family hydrolase [Acidimicrobiales bacterium]|nr:HAD family hydrolase [Acidimicrobiales bacterium]
MALRAVIFDLDDTLIVEEATARASMRSAARLAAGIDADQAVEVILAAARRVWRAGPQHRVAVDLGIASWEGLWSHFEGCHPCLDELAAWAPTYREQAWTAALRDLGLDDPGFVSAMADAYEKAQRGGHPLVDGAADTVRNTAAGYRLGLLTNGPADIQRIKLGRTGLAGCFDAVAISGQTGLAKPAAGAFEVVLDSLRVSADEVVMVGDSWERDIRGALQIGITPVWVSGGRPAPETDPRVAVISSVAGLPAVLDALDEAAARG